MIHVLIVVMIVGIVLWMINAYVPMQSNVKQILNVVVILLLLFWLLGVFNVIPARF